MAAELKRDPENDAEKVSLFRKIQKSRYRAAINRRYYSYYRVIQAAIEGFAGKQKHYFITLLLKISFFGQSSDQ